MKIIKYEKKGNNTYKVYLENNQTIILYEDIILKYNLLYKKEIDETLLKKIDKDNSEEEIYTKCIKYISVRIRSIYEVEEYLKRKSIEESIIEKIVDKLLSNGLLNDETFTKAFIHDKLNFTTMGPYKIEQELKKHQINSSIINEYICNIDEDIIDTKINKQINKLIKSNRKKTNLRNKIYLNLLNLGYSNEMILRNINKYEL